MAKSSKPFDPFADDDLEFQPEMQSQPTTIREAPEPATQIKSRPRPGDEPRWKEVVERTAVKAPPQKPKHHLNLNFEELADQGGDVRGATKIGSDQLAADDFLTGVKKQDYDEALDRAHKSQRVMVSAALPESRVVRTVKTPIYVFWTAVIAFIALLVGGGFAFKAWYDRSERERIEALQKLNSPR